MIPRRTWYQWTTMHWVITATVSFSDSDVLIVSRDTTRWWVVAYFHMIIYTMWLNTKYENAKVESWLEWKT